MADMQVLGNLVMAGHVCKKHIGNRCHDHRTDSQSIQSVGEVYRVRCPHNDQTGERNVPDAQVR